MFTFSCIRCDTDYWPAEEVAFATIYSRGPKEGKAKRVWGGGPRALGIQSHCPLTPCLGTPADCWIVLHKGLSTKDTKKIKINRKCILVRLAAVLHLFLPQHYLLQVWKFLPGEISVTIVFRLVLIYFLKIAKVHTQVTLRSEKITN